MKPASCAARQRRLLWLCGPALPGGNNSPSFSILNRPATGRPGLQNHKGVGCPVTLGRSHPSRGFAEAMGFSWMMEERGLFRPVRCASRGRTPGPRCGRVQPGTDKPGPPVSWITGRSPPPAARSVVCRELPGGSGGSSGGDRIVPDRYRFTGLPDRGGLQGSGILVPGRNILMISASHSPVAGECVGSAVVALCKRAAG